MNNLPYLACPKCGHNVIITSAEPEPDKDLVGALCARCVRTITEDDISAQALKIIVV